MLGSRLKRVRLDGVKDRCRNKTSRASFAAVPFGRSRALQVLSNRGIEMSRPLGKFALSAGMVHINVGVN